MPRIIADSDRVHRVDGGDAPFSHTPAGALERRPPPHRIPRAVVACVAPSIRVMQLISSSLEGRRVSIRRGASKSSPLSLRRVSGADVRQQSCAMTSAGDVIPRSGEGGAVARSTRIARRAPKSCRSSVSFTSSLLPPATCASRAGRATSHSNSRSGDRARIAATTAEVGAAHTRAGPARGGAVVIPTRTPAAASCPRQRRRVRDPGRSARR